MVVISQNYVAFSEYMNFNDQIRNDGSILAFPWFLDKYALKYKLHFEKEPSLESARIWPKPLTRRAEKTNSMTQFWFIGLNYCSNDAINIVG